MTRPYILRTEPTDSGESGYRPPSREWLKSKRVKRLNFAHLLDAEIKKTVFMARIESLGGTIRSGGWCGRLKRVNSKSPARLRRAFREERERWNRWII